MTSWNGVTLVTGGTGLIGGEAIVDLLARGHRVRAVVRESSEAAARNRLEGRLAKSPGFRRALLAGLDVVAGESRLERFGLTPSELADVGTIIHCAANTQFSDQQDDAVWATNVQGARNLVAAGRAARPDVRVVLVSTASVATAPECSLLYEDAAQVGHENVYTRSKREAEAIVQSSDLDVVIVRPSIVLSRGLQDRALARSILWAVPIMAELGEVPVDGDAHIDLVPVDHVAWAICAIAEAPALAFDVYHVSAGRSANRFDELLDAVERALPDMAPITPVGRNARISSRRRRYLMRPLQAYLPFINAGVRYATDRLEQQFGSAAMPPVAATYAPDLVRLISVDEALEEMYHP